MSANAKKRLRSTDKIEEEIRKKNQYNRPKTQEGTSRSKINERESAAPMSGTEIINNENE